MATGISNTTTYAGEFAGKYIASALFSARTLEAQAITIAPNVKYKKVVKTVSNTDAIADAECDFTPVGTVALDERVLEPKSLQINEVLCKLDFEDDWDAVQMGYSAFDVLPSSFTEFFIVNMMGIVADATEISIWQGDGAVSGEFAGFTTLWALDATVVDVDSGVISIDAANVVAEMTKVYVAASTLKIYGKEDLVFYVSANIYASYQLALGGFGSAGLGSAGVDNQGTLPERTLSFAGIPVFLAYGMPANQMAIAQKSNLWFGTGLMSDFNKVAVIDTADTLGDENVRFVMRYTAGVQYGYGAEVVYYWDAP